MSQKRQQEDGKSRSEGNSSEDKRRKLKNVVQDVMRMQSLQRYLEPLIRKVVKEEVESALKKHISSIKQDSRKETSTTESRSLQLHFLNALSLPVFTGARVEGEDCFAIKVALVDANTGKIVSTGPESSAKVEIAVLEGDFDGDDGNIWTHEEFISNIVRERDGKKPLLTGDAFLNLKEGIGFIGEISFTDNSSWTRSRRFRLGARVVDNFDGTIVREAKTESFIVRDHRGELYKKHHPPSLFDEVWRLEKIGKDGAFHRRLTRENIKTVKDFLTMLVIDASRLRHVLGTGMSAKMWEVTVEHARTCVLDKRMYMYSPPGSPQKTGVVFNMVGQVLGLLSECQYIPTEKMSETERVDAQNLVTAAFEHWEGVVSFDDESSLTGGISQLSNVVLSSSPPTTENSNASTILASHKTGGFDYAQPDLPSPDIMQSAYTLGNASGLDDYTLHRIQNIDLKYDQTLSFAGQLPSSLICDIESINQAFCDVDHLQFFDTDLQSQNVSLESEDDLQSALDSFLLARAIGKAQTRWTKISSVLKWFSIRKLVALKRSRVRETPSVDDLLQLSEFRGDYGNAHVSTPVYLPFKQQVKKGDYFSMLDPQLPMSCLDKETPSVKAYIYMSLSTSPREKTEEMQNYKGHVVVLTYPAQGHMSPLLQFAKRLANKGLKATLATTHYTVKSIDATTVGIEPISDGFDEGGFKQAPNLQAYLESFRSVGSRTLAELVKKFNDSASPVNCIVYDSLLPWALDVARQFGIYGSVFLTNSNSVCSFYWQIDHGFLALPPKQENMPLLLPGLPPLGFSDLPSFIAKPESQTAYLLEILEQFSRLKENDWVFCNSFEELESELVKAMLGLWPLMMVGPMVPSAYLDQQIQGDKGYGASFWEQNSDKCVKWLEKKQPKSVIYISFGSMADIVAKQLEEIAWGLKASNKHFLWVTRESQNKLPIEFVNSLGEEGLLVEWCNQLEVLAHQAVGCFVTHCGWNSTLEGLSLGVPMVSITQSVDQPTNAKFVEEWRVGVRAKKDGEGIVTKEELKVCIEEVMVGENSEEIGRNAKKYRELAKRAVGLGGSSDKNISEFVMKVIKDKGKQA